MARRTAVYLNDPKTKKKTKIYEVLEGLGELCLEKYGGRISTTVVQRYNSTLGSLFKTKDRIPVLLRLMKRVDPKFSSIVYKPGAGGVPNRQNMTKEQESILYSLMEENLDIIVEGSKKDKNQLYERINDSLVEAGCKPRTTQSISQLIRHRLYENQKELPSRLVNSKSLRMQRRIEEDIQEIEDGVQDFEICGSKDERRASRGKINQYTPIGHQKLIAYLMDPENVKKVFGFGMDLICVDFREEDTDPELYEAFKRRALDIENRLEDNEITDIIDGWIRFDMLFEKPNGTYAIVEIKQRALDKPKKSKRKKKVLKDLEGKLTEENIRAGAAPNFDNATKALKQIGGYSGMLTEIIRKKDFEERDNPEHVSLRNPVEAHLVAYEIEKDLFDYLSGVEGRGAHPISREAVNNYIQVYLGRENKKPRERKISETEVRVKNKRKIGGKEKEFQTRKLNFLNFQRSLERSGAEPATINVKKGLIELDGVLYKTNGSREHNRKIKDLINQGRIIVGHINTMKYKGSRRIEI